MQHNGPVLDWIRLRRALANLRRTAGLEESQLARRIRVHKSTIYRIEDVDRLPNHKPDLATLEAWLLATDGPEIDEFFRVVKTPTGLHAKPPLPAQTTLHGSNAGDTTTSRSHQQEASSHGARVESSPASAEILASVVDGLTALSVDLAEVAARAQGRLRVAGAGEDRPGESRITARLERTIPQRKKRLTRRSK